MIKAIKSLAKILRPDMVLDDKTLFIIKLENNIIVACQFQYDKETD